MKNEKENLMKNIVALLKTFRNRPNHLAKYLLDNQAFSEYFTNKIEESEILNILSIEDIEIPNFEDFNEMDDFFDNMIQDKESIDLSVFLDEDGSVKKDSNLVDLNNDLEESELNIKLKRLIEEEDYEEAVKVRDYMISNNYKIF